MPIKTSASRFHMESGILYFFLCRVRHRGFASRSRAAVSAAMSPGTDLPDSGLAAPVAPNKNERLFMVGSRFGMPAPKPPPEPHHAEEPGIHRHRHGEAACRGGEADGAAQIESAAALAGRRSSSRGFRPPVRTSLYSSRDSKVSLAEPPREARLRMPPTFPTADFLARPDPI